MIRLIEATLLAGTKLRTHKVRTGITIGIAGILFGLVVLIISVTQGVFGSVDRFSEVGLNSRAVIAVADTNYSTKFNEYDHMNDQTFIAEVEAEHAAIVAKKKAAAKKYDIPYDAASEDPLPIGTDKITKEKSITFDGLSSKPVQNAAAKRRMAVPSTFNVESLLEPYHSDIRRGTFTPLAPTDGRVVYMKDGKETIVTTKTDTQVQQESTQDPTISVLDASLSKPFVSNTSFDPAKGEIPVIVPVVTAEKLLKLTPLDKTATAAEQYERLSYVRSHISEATASYCYRNQASEMLLAHAITQQDEQKQSNTNPDYVKPSVVYALPAEADCGGVTIVSDTRTAAQKKVDENQIAYEKEIGTYIGEPFQQKITLRGVGISSEFPDTSKAWSITGMVQSLLGSSLGFNSFAIPQDMLDKVADQYKPAQVFSPAPTDGSELYNFNTYLVEFTDKTEARSLLEKSGAFNGNFSTTFSAYPFGSAALFIDEFRNLVEKVLFWVLVVVSAIATIIMAGIIGRTVAEGRRESAVFRAIGASRSDIARIYGMYALLLSLRIVVFAGVLGLGLAVALQVLFGEDATIGAQLAYAIADPSTAFMLFTLQSWYLLAVVGVILLVGIVASIIPIILGSRRSPIRDMRNDM